MSGDSVPVNIQILDKEYMVSCPEDERDALLESAKLLNSKMQEARDSGKVLGTERIAVMTALNIIHEFLQHKRYQEDVEIAVGQRLSRLEEKIDVALGRRT